MKSYYIFLLLLAVYITFLIATGWYFNRRQTSLREFLLAGRRAGTLSIGFSAAASWLTAGAMLAVIGFFMLLGMGSIWGFVAPNIIALLGIALLVGKIRSIPAMTQPELLEIRYGSFLRMPVAIIIIVVMILFSVADIKGFSMVLQIFYGINRLQAAMIVAIAVAVYVTLGGLSAVIATDIIQYLCLACFILVMTVLVLASAGNVSSLNVTEMVLTVDHSWWNPLSIGLPMVMIFSFAIIPGWVSEQDPWQKIWAAGNAGAARKGMVVGAFLIAVVFAGCAFIALGLNRIYPDIAQMGFPMGMSKAEPALLTFITGHGYSNLFVAFCAVALAAAAMSCIDTFSMSGASCVARDIYQRQFNPGATMKQMLTVNRLSVLVIICFATLGSFFINSIIDAIHIATFIASASYFFLLIGGIFWPRGTAAGAVASMIVGFVSQCSLIVIDLVKTPAGSLPYLETVHPLLMGHGVIVAMALSGIVYVAVSFATSRSELFRLAPFFPEMAEILVKENSFAIPSGASSLPEERDIIETVHENLIYYQLKIDLPLNLSWRELISLISSTHPYWLSLSGIDSIRRCTKADILSCVSLVRGEQVSNAWLEAEGSQDNAYELRKEIAVACQEVQNLLGKNVAAARQPV